MARVEAILGRRATSWRRVDRGYTAAERWVARLEDGSSAFVKAATDEDTAAWLRAEHGIYAAVRGAFLPAMLGWREGARPALVLEDLSAAAWPPPWSRERVEAVLATLAAVAAAPAPGLASLETMRAELSGWTVVARDPAPFLALRVCTPAWLERALPALLDAQARAELAGDDLVHLDVRCDNVCFVGARVAIVDWNWACRGRGRFDVACWLPSLEMEGGPRPDEILPDAGSYAALLAGFFAARAGLPPPRGAAPALRPLQLAQLRVALPWAARALGLEPVIPSASAPR